MATVVAAGGLSFSAPIARFQDAGLALNGTRDPFDMDDEAFFLLRSVAAAWETRRRAIALCARAEQCRAGLEHKLAARGHPRDAVRAALDELESEGLLSDERYARAWLRMHSGKRGQGPAKLMASLRARGVPESAAKAAMAEYPVREALLAEYDAAFGGDTPARMPEDLRRRLREMGFRPADIDAAFDARLDGAGQY